MDATDQEAQHFSGCPRTDDLALLYQPIVGLDNGEILAVEALIRWQHPTLGTLPPASFLNNLLLSDQRGDVTEWIFREALGQLRQWRLNGVRSVRMAINLSLVELEDPKIVSLVQEWTSDAQVDSCDIDLEITERAGLLESHGVRDTVMQLSEAGFRISIDDFGAGDASLRYLIDLPATAIKLDRSIVHGIPERRHSAIIVGVARTAEDLGCQLIIEGLETFAQEQFLLRNGIRCAQGYYLGKPTTHSEMFHTLKTSSRRRADA